MWAYTPVLTPERKVWRAVLTQAFEDAELAPNDEGIALETLECSRAREYLRADNLEEAEHLRLVCDYAEIPADRLILWARRRYAAMPSVELGEVREVKDVKDIQEVKDESAFDGEVSCGPLFPLPPLLPLLL